MEFFNDVGGDPSRPSLFELIAQEQLRDLLQPAMKYVLSVFAQRYPRYLLRIVNRHEEFYALIMMFVERYYLRKHNASFAENFYGLKRRKKPLYEMVRSKAAVGSPAGEGKLREKDIRRSLLFLVAIPYLRAKAQDYYELLGGGADPRLFEEEHRPRSDGVDTLSGRLRSIYKNYYPWLNMGFELWLLCYNIAYLLDRISYYRPWLAWIGVDLRRVGPEDITPKVPFGTPDKPRLPRPVLQNIWRLLQKSPRLILDSFRVLLPTAIFFVKFLEWWYSPSSPARAVSAPEKGPRVPPPKMLKPHPQGIPVDPRNYGICPLCNSSITNATALPSGYVFCFRCAHKCVEDNGTCPVTLIPVKIWQLRRIMV